MQDSPIKQRAFIRVSPEMLFALDLPRESSGAFDRTTECLFYSRARGVDSVGEHFELGVHYWHTVNRKCPVKIRNGRFSFLFRETGLSEVMCRLARDWESTRLKQAYSDGRPSLIQPREL